MNITCTIQSWEQINWTLYKDNWIIQKTHWLYFYYFIQENTEKETKETLSGRLGFEKNSNDIKYFQFKNNSNTEIFQLLDNISIDRLEGLCNELRWEKQPIIVI